MHNKLGQLTQDAFIEKLKQRENDLSAGRPNNLFSHRVEIRHGDGSLFQLNFASMHESGPHLFVFTEHNGALGFFLDDLEAYQYLNTRVSAILLPEQA